MQWEQKVVQERMVQGGKGDKNKRGKRDRYGNWKGKKEKGVFKRLAPGWEGER